MDRLDWVTFLAAIIFVICIALYVNYPKTGGGALPGTENINSYPDSCSDGSCCMPKVHYTYNVTPKTGPIKINYNNELGQIYSSGSGGYPRLILPDLNKPTGDVSADGSNTYYTMSSSFYSSDIFSSNLWESGNITTFAFFDGKNSGFSEVLGVPYQLWRIRSSMTCKGNPAYSSLTWALVDYSTGDIITGGYILPDNEIVKKVEISNRKMYFMINAENVQSFSLDLETPEMAYEEAHITPKLTSLVDFLNTMQN
ncbi:hypothetical protein J2128_000222 [Methanomicrobium sp. W14]|uniref:hypothetical protein n=1 Tax=Methanomicrobium sp. W14 TaxID=2817839 RepID=UPI001AE3DEF2|nr:hypothetical protein [Methanomicrobium sp. W14]MBP2132301.1 hypothetical protein [Methanomicrobium sp. W14]